MPDAVALPCERYPDPSAEGVVGVADASLRPPPPREARGGHKAQARGTHTEPSRSAGPDPEPDFLGRVSARVVGRDATKPGRPRSLAACALDRGAVVRSPEHIRVLRNERPARLLRCEGSDGAHGKRQEADKRRKSDGPHACDANRLRRALVVAVRAPPRRRLTSASPAMRNPKAGPAAYFLLGGEGNRRTQTGPVGSASFLALPVLHSDVNDGG
jgi:hypothetical protein